MKRVPALSGGLSWLLIIYVLASPVQTAREGKKTVKGGTSGNLPKGLPPSPKTSGNRPVERPPEWNLNDKLVEKEPEWEPVIPEKEVVAQIPEGSTGAKYVEQVEQEVDESTGTGPLGPGFGQYREGGPARLNDQDTPPQEIIKSYVSPGQFCSTWGPHFYRTFDGRLYRYPGHCRHILFKDCIHEEVFNAVLDFTHCTSSSLSKNVFEYSRQDSGQVSSVTECIPKAIVSSGEESISISVGPGYSWNIMRRNQPVTLPLVLDTISIQPAGKHIRVKAACGAMMWISPEGSMTVELPAGWRWRTCGLCGHKDGNPREDFQSPTNQLMTDTWSFGNSWMMKDPSEPFPDGCPDPERPTSSPCDRDNLNDQNEIQKSSEKCLHILSPLFESCHHVVDPQLYLESCHTSCCAQESAEGCECSAMAEYFRECQRQGGRLPEEGWRTNSLCPMTCTNGTVYGECVETCAPTCYDADPVCDINNCLDGCHCPPGYVMHEGNCLDSTLCPCSLGDKEYPGGHTLKEDCNTCQCVSGKWKCTETICAAACRLVGNRHIVTFDGFYYELPRACSHYLLYADGYSVQLENVPCRGSSIKGFSGNTACGRNIVITSKQGDPVIKLKKWLEVTADGEEVLNLPTTISDVHIRIISSLYVQALLPNGVSVTWNSDANSGWISVPPSFYGKTQGLCGTFTRNQADDLLTPEGDTELGPVAFARKWKTDPSCVGPQENEIQEHSCDRQPGLRTQAEAVCTHIVTSDMFAECQVDVAPYYGGCLRELCSCPDEKIESCFCPIMEQLAAECSKKTGSPLHWRNAVPQCGIHCSGGQEYIACSDACQYSCNQRSNPYSAIFQELEGTCGSGVAGEPCLDGCSCPRGQALTTLREGVQACVPIEQCPCLYEGGEYPPNFVQERQGKICTCHSGTWRCSSDPKRNLTDLDGRGYVSTPCPEDSNTESSGCLSDCPVTCLNMHNPPKCHTRICKGGCRCKNGFVLETVSGRCVRPGQCPCHHGGISYQDGQPVKMDCNNCLCKGGQWVCETAACLGKCSLHGSGHYTTFDGRDFDLDAANCAYVLVRGKTPEGVAFAITSQNLPCAAASYNIPGVACKKEVIFTIGRESVTMSQESPIQVSSDWTLEKVGMFEHLVNHKLNIEILWDGKTRVYVHADPKWKGQFRGLCGDFNGDAVDDFVGPAEGPPQATASHFVNSWRVHDYCSSTTSLQERDSTDWVLECSPEKERWARHQCQVLKSELFAPCHVDVDHEKYLERCVEDACMCEQSGGTCDCLCTAIAVYGDACAARGISIAWRSQELCPIQCEDCDRYNPCIPVCPLESCEDRLQNGRHDCTGRPCVEGCQLKPCPEETVRNGTTRDDVCVPEALCEPHWDCLINGKTFKHGDWISDATLSDACRTCYCHRGEVDCKGQTCPPLPRLVETTEFYTTEAPPVTTEEIPYSPLFMPITTTIAPPLPPAEKQFCKSHGWSHWINAFTPTIESGGDYEILNDKTSRLRTHVKLPCSLSNMTSIQCRPVAPNPKGKPVDDFECALPTGLVCKNNRGLKGKSGVCRDYEIRVYCMCEPARGRIEISHVYPNTTTPIPYTSPVPTTPSIPIIPYISKETAPPETVTLPPVPIWTTICLPENHGWTNWINTKDGRTDSIGDLETVEGALGRMASLGYGGCPLDHVVDIQCRVASDGRSWKEAEQNDVICDILHGLTCLHGKQPKGRKCLDYEIRVFCQCYTTPSTPPTVHAISTEGPCPPGVEWSECPYRCDQTCKAFQHKLVVEGKCEPVEPHSCVPGCQYVDCQPPYIQLDEYTCVQAAECDCVLDDGTILGPGNVIQKNCKRCDCQNNDLFCADVPYCGIGSTGAPQILETTTTCAPPATPLCHEGFTVALDTSGPCPAYNCVPECPPDLQWYECHATCERSCLSIKSRPCENEGCVAGCFCPPGLVRDGDHCKDPIDCPDRVCQGFGDPQLVTFDGSIFNFQGKGTFTLANHMESSFTVSGRSEPCDGKLNCMVGLTVTFKGHKVTVRRGQNTIGVDEHLVSIEQTPIEVGGGSIMVLAHPGLNVLIHIPELSTEVYYFGSHAAFAIQVPVHIFFNRTNGLCGNCNKQPEDDIPEKKKIPDPSDICSYMTEGFYAECMDENKVPPPDVTDEKIKELCPEFDDYTFVECTRLVDTRMYRMGCARDILQGSDHKVAVCKALLEFTRQCCTVSGYALDSWMQKIGCEVTCPGGSSYVQCHDSCPQTCTNASASTQVACSGIKTDACFCPPEMVFHNGHCIDKVVCEQCDPEGHRPGDTWQDGPCSSCHCDSDLKVVCTTKSCPTAPACRHDENLIVDEASDPCCLKYRCELKPVPACPPLVMPVCKPGETAKVITLTGECPAYQCECDPTLCPALQWPTGLELGQKVDIVQGDACCGYYEVVCDEGLCPERPTCPPGTTLKEVPGVCCTSYKCRPPEDMCVYTPQKTVFEGQEVPLSEEMRIPELYHPGQVWLDGLCRNCTCVESTTRETGYSSSCMVEQCSKIDDSPDKDDYVMDYIPIPDHCCPLVARIFCKDDLGELYEVGSEWKSANNTCLSYRCELSPHGDVQKVEKSIVCATCPEGNEYVAPSARLGICCGWCRPVFCEEAGRTYALGASWNSTTRPCYTAECVASETGSGVKTVYQGPQCPMIPKECPENKMTWDESGCCQICNMTMMPVSECQPTVVPEEETVGLLVVHDARRGRCANTKPVYNLKQCAGNCQSHSLLSLDDGYFQSNCECCVADSYSSVTVSLNCEDWMKSVLLKTFKQPESCKCSVCSSSGGGHPEVERIKTPDTSRKGGWSFPADDSYSQLRDSFSQQKISDRFEQIPNENENYEQRPNGDLKQEPYNEHYEQRPSDRFIQEETRNENYEQRPTGQLTDNSDYVQRPTGVEPERPARQQQEPFGNQDYGEGIIDARSKGLPRVETRDITSHQTRTDYGQPSSSSNIQQSPLTSSDYTSQQRQPSIPVNPNADQFSQIRQDRLDTTGSSGQNYGQSPFNPNQNVQFPEQRPHTTNQDLGETYSQSRQRVAVVDNNSPFDVGGQSFNGNGYTSGSEQSSGSYNSQSRQQGSASGSYSPFDQGGQNSNGNSYKGGSGYTSGSSYSQSSYSSQDSPGNENNLDEWHRQMAEHQKQIQDLQNLQKTYSDLAQSQHEQQLQDLAALNQQQLERTYQQQRSNEQVPRFPG